jgi:hypothetical protein
MYANSKSRFSCFHVHSHRRPPYSENDQYRGASLTPLTVLNYVLFYMSLHIIVIFLFIPTIEC